MLISGHADYEDERRALFPKDGGDSIVRVLVATPGRLVEHLVDPSADIDLSSLAYLVVDEADRMQGIARMEWLKLVESRANGRRWRPIACNYMHVDLAQAWVQLTYASLTNPGRNRWLRKILLSATLSLDVDNLHMWNLRAPQLFRADTRRVAEESMAQYAAKPDGQTLILPSQLVHRVVSANTTIIDADYVNGYNGIQIVGEQSMKPLLLSVIFAEMMRVKGKGKDGVDLDLGLPQGDVWKKSIVFTNKR